MPACHRFCRSGIQPSAPSVSNRVFSVAIFVFSAGGNSLGEALLRFKIVNEDFLAEGLEDFGNEFEVRRMVLIRVLGLLGLENDVEGDLIRLIHNRAMAPDHFANVKMEDSRNAFQILVGAGEEFVGRVFDCRIRPKDDNV